jgi:hypothetical protein
MKDQFFCGGCNDWKPYSSAADASKLRPICTTCKAGITERLARSSTLAPRKANVGTIGHAGERGSIISSLAPVLANAMRKGGAK